MTGKSKLNLLSQIKTLSNGCRTRTHDEVCAMFNNKYPHRTPIRRATVGKIIKKELRKLGIHVIVRKVDEILYQRKQRQTFCYL